ncbi:thiol oxidoreductase [Rubellimicrobium rubrum]|uniref:Thiol oxidoreductase n=1 Tax=Rubellimicrobium rubrum TaxID=2585369 RepID=A0A5C4N0G2_9RHOB|nr:di-heme oxidoredictase family protein [Rubellimicrobium rubrum]TNC50841.1 thiol oxidoreductase [Rubellimicrobium rubrum]
MLALAGTAGLAAPLAQSVGDPHLRTIPRTLEEVGRVAAVTVPPSDFSTSDRYEGMPAGAATVRARGTADAFSQPSGNMSFEGELDFKVGNGLFRKTWVSSPSSTQASDGLGPLFNARSCQGCHVKDGRGHPPDGLGDDSGALILRVSIPSTDEEGAGAIREYLASWPEPTYGSQIQTRGVAGQVPEAKLAITYEDVEVRLSDGQSAFLRRPTYELQDLAYGPLHPDAMLSPRIAPQMIGLGLLEAIPASDILAHADEDDADKDGISGRPNMILSPEFGEITLGRFGHKAGTATIREQSAAAFAGDMGLSTSLNAAAFGECTEVQLACRSAPDGGDASRGGLEVDDESLDLVAFYARNLGVPARRDESDPEVLRGKQVFHETGCPACHQPSFVTHRLENRPEQSFQLIWPYTDMLLHDMGDGLADHRPEGQASGTEWRTAPLWGVGLTEQVSGRATFLHDGRARSLLEAILWHGGEAQAPRDRVVTMPRADREALIRFLESL